MYTCPIQTFMLWDSQRQHHFTQDPGYMLLWWRMVLVMVMGFQWGQWAETLIINYSSVESALMASLQARLFQWKTCCFDDVYNTCLNRRQTSPGATAALPFIGSFITRTPKVFSIISFIQPWHAIPYIRFVKIFNMLISGLFQKNSWLRSSYGSPSP